MFWLFLLFSFIIILQYPREVTGAVVNQVATQVHILESFSLYVQTPCQPDGTLYLEVQDPSKKPGSEFQLCPLLLGELANNSEPL